jgi:hypothetical protein
MSNYDPTYLHGHLRPHIHLCHINIHTCHHHISRIKCGACHHTHLGCLSTLLGGTPNICIKQGGTSSTRSIGHHSIQSSGTGPARLPDHSAAKANQSSRGAYRYNLQQDDKRRRHQNRNNRCRHIRK